MNIKLLEEAKKKVPSVPVLVNLISMRVRELNSGKRPYVNPSGPNEDRMDIALREVAEGKLIAEIDFDTIAKRGQVKFS